ncbi:hypothetical protein SBD_2900 [Streptomyces bottropensis ATCC 25435]|uniref:Uncharacterized protein n=1 Tax=Streptomyces bottropensis ATCC 25435 TaxID=1054862 RepID=M3DFW8_9ACTN|nr:hypothetical protein SBD_2900 [Streptomyces bottropensis ATCC 25435]
MAGGSAGRPSAGSGGPLAGRPGTSRTADGVRAGAAVPGGQVHHAHG